MDAKSFELIKDFTSDLWEGFGREGINPLSLYHRLINKELSDENKRKVITPFKNFSYNHYEDISKESIPVDVVISFGDSEKIYLEIGKFIKESDEETKTVIYQHLITIASSLETDEERKENLSKTLVSISKPKKNSDFMKSLMDKVSTIDTGDIPENAKPTDAIKQMLNSGALEEMFDMVNKGVENGDLDVSSVMKSMGGMMKAFK